MSTSSLRDAIMAGAWTVVAELVGCEPARARERDSGGNLPLHVALVCGAPLETVSSLLAAHRPAAAERDGGGVGNTPLHLAAAHGGGGVVAELLVAAPGGAAARNGEGAMPAPPHRRTAAPWPPGAWHDAAQVDDAGLSRAEALQRHAGAEMQRSRKRLAQQGVLPQRATRVLLWPRCEHAPASGLRVAASARAAWRRRRASRAAPRAKPGAGRRCAARTQGPVGTPPPVRCSVARRPSCLL